ncbi:NAD(P)H-dependent flavin oxidoreductase [Arthrobacter caoxuetaonis]|uniref:Propionate 3-nitronate monooxygenase n=1 Tax=Arthrobacter caoxuetaonis TaxID=2886935 RepID=A0A9X1SCL9_9MICC|nr:nitronate monooxygenase [Arthrobacter caoxuetaonis]MCC3297836.1 nitronate monooxygenase [Arthrobacter caoxuetaonis]USQ55974.1 nitronate monooxygenase [Arthrobacter caoxuetaonis]
MNHPILPSRLPIAAAPMAGGPTTTALASAVAEAGGFPFLAGGYKTPEALAAEISMLRASGHPFGVNLFVPAPDPVDEAAFRAYARRLQPEADRYGLTLSEQSVADVDFWEEKLALLLRDPVPVVSLTFALPEPADIAALQAAGTRVLASVTLPAEARQAEAAGVDGLVVQGPDAGGHSATFDPARRIEPVSTEDLVRSVSAETVLPIIAAGGVDGPAAVRTLLAAGAEAVAVGTLLLRADEAGTSPTHRTALADDTFTETVPTRAFTGRPARALRNAFIDRHEPDALNAYPAVHHLTRALRQAAGKSADADTLHLWAGTGWRSAPSGPAAGVVGWLAGEQPEPSQSSL